MDALRDQEDDGAEQYDDGPGLAGLLVLLKILACHALMVKTRHIHRSSLAVPVNQARMLNLRFTNFSFKTSVEQAADLIGLLLKWEGGIQLVVKVGAVVLLEAGGDAVV